MQLSSATDSSIQPKRRSLAWAKSSGAVAVLFVAGLSLASCSQSHVPSQTTRSTESPTARPTGSPTSWPTEAAQTLGSTATPQKKTAAPSADGHFQLTGSMDHADLNETATLLQDGRVLIVGPIAGAYSTVTAELYDPATRAFEPTGKITNSLNEAQAANLLQDGRVLVIDFPSAELYDPKTGYFSPTGSMIADSSEAAGPHDVRPYAYNSLNATLLQDGRVLITSSSSDAMDFGSPGQLYDPKTGQFQLVPTIHGGSYGAKATLLTDGRVLVAGGRDSSAYLYDPKTGSVDSAGAMVASGYAQTATLLRDGRVLLAGGTTDNGACLTSSELFDATTDTFSPTDDLLPTGALSPTDEPYPFCAQQVALLHDGRVFVVGSDSAQLYNPKTGSFSAAGSMTTTRTGCTATLLEDGRVLIAGGAGSAILATAEIYTP